MKNIIDTYAPLLESGKVNTYLIGVEGEPYSLGSWYFKVYDMQEKKELVNPIIHIRDVSQEFTVELVASGLMERRISLLDPYYQQRYHLSTTRIKQLFIVPITERYIDACAPNAIGTRHCYPVVVKDNRQNDIGLNYYTDKPITDLASFNFQQAATRMLIGERNSWLYIPNYGSLTEGSPEAALELLKTYTTCGGDIGAVRHNISREVIMKMCGNMYADPNDRLICGHPSWEGRMVHGEHSDGCVIFDYVPPLNCPYYEHWSRFHNH